MTQLSFLEVTETSIVRCMVCPEFWTNMGEATLHDHSSDEVLFTTELEGWIVITDAIGFPVKIKDRERGVRCGCCKNRHHSAKAVKLCYLIDQEQAETAEADFRAMEAETRYYENRGSEEIAAHDAYEARNGMMSQTEAWHIASPHTCPCCN